MSHFARYAVVSILSMSVGFVACRTLRESVGSKDAATVSTFEVDALGFVNWYRIAGRDAIPHEELTRNLRILESKAVASGKLISTHKPQTPAEQPLDQKAP